MIEEQGGLGRELAPLIGVVGKGDRRFKAGGKPFHVSRRVWRRASRAADDVNGVAVPSFWGGAVLSSLGDAMPSSLDETA